MSESAEYRSTLDSAQEASVRLNERYATVGESIATLFRATTKEEPKRWPGRIRFPGFGKQKDTRAKDTLTHVKEVFQSHFPDPKQQGQVVERADQFLHKLATSIDPNEPIYDDHLKNFISSFPDNILTQLGDQASAETVKRIFQIGCDAIDVHMRKVAEAPVDRIYVGNIVNGSLGWISSFLTSDLPQAISNAGDAREALMAKLEETAKHQPFGKLESMAKFYSTGIYEPSPVTLGNIARLDARIAEIDPRTDTSSSPFNRADREPWKGRTELVMGTEDRMAAWKDLAEMARSTEEDDIEFGMTFSRDPRDGSLRTEFKRGDGESIHNNGDYRGREDIIFFHSHPSTSPDKELFAPLVSTGDLAATAMSDYGGKYYNVATVNGVTFHTGVALDSAPPAGVTGDNSWGAIYTIESGELSGSWFKPVMHDKTIEIMQGVKNERKPFAYSIYDQIDKQRHYFVHIPWDNIDGSVPFEEVCYKGGLSDLVGRIKDLPQLPLASNIEEGLRYKT